MSDGLEPGIESPPVETPSVETPPVADTSGGHPAWDEALTHIPGVLHERVKPVFQKWDDNVQKKIAEVQSRYAPYDQFVNQGVRPEQIDASLRLAMALQEDPQAVYDYLAEQLGIKGDQGRRAGSGTVNMGDLIDDEDEPRQVDDPRIGQLEKQQQQLIATMQHQMQVEEQRQGDVWLAEKQASITAKYPNVPLDWDYIINKASVDGQRSRNFDAALDKAAESYVGLLGRMRANNSSAPSVIPPGGGVPTSQVKVSELKDQDRRKYVFDVLTAIDKD